MNTNDPTPEESPKPLRRWADHPIHDVMAEQQRIHDARIAELHAKLDIEHPPESTSRLMWAVIILAALAVVGALVWLVSFWMEA